MVGKVCQRKTWTKSYLFLLRMIVDNNQIIYIGISL